MQRGRRCRRSSRGRRPIIDHGPRSTVRSHWSTCPGSAASVASGTCVGPDSGHVGTPVRARGVGCSIASVSLLEPVGRPRCCLPPCGTTVHLDPRADGRQRAKLRHVRRAPQHGYGLDSRARRSTDTPGARLRAQEAVCLWLFLESSAWRVGGGKDAVRADVPCAARR